LGSGLGGEGFIIYYIDIIFLTPAMTTKLTLEQQRKIEDNRKKALEIRARRLGHVNPASPKSSEQVSSINQSAQCAPTASPASRLGPQHHPFIPPFKKDSNLGTKSISGKPSDNKPSISPSSSGGVVGSFYKPVAQSNPSPQAPPSLKSSSMTAGPPSTKPFVSTRGKCVSHSKDRFRVEVGYHAELIAVFKSIQSKTYGKCLPYCKSMFDIFDLLLS
jgi:hypothetical protein